MVITVQGIIGLHVFLPYPPSKVAFILSENGTTVLMHDTPILICCHFCCYHFVFPAKTNASRTSAEVQMNRKLK